MDVFLYIPKKAYASLRIMCNETDLLNAWTREKKTLRSCSLTLPVGSSRWAYTCSVRFLQRSNNPSSTSSQQLEFSWNYMVLFWYLAFASAAKIVSQPPGDVFKYYLEVLDCRPLVELYLCVTMSRSLANAC